MAHSHPIAGPTKMSFAKIAAMPAPGRTQSPNPAQKDSSSTASPPEKHPRRETVIQHGHVVPDVAPLTNPVVEAANAIERLALEPSLLPSDSQSPLNTGCADSFDEVASELSTSSLNKPHSFDTKSLASVTTFAMDDKESIRPDDSASVRAADDDAPNPVLSRHPSFQSEVEQSMPKPPRFVVPGVTMAPRRYATLANPPRFGNMPVASAIEPVIMPQLPPMPVIDPDEPREPVVQPTIVPDERLIDALSSPKDRVPLLQLEHKILSFLRSSPSDVFELPPQNAFSRLLTHKLADYYGLAHHVNDENSSVRIFRTGYRALPTPLAELAQSIPTSITAGASSNTVKIMRREALGPRFNAAAHSTAPSSSNPSKPTSESGADFYSEEGLQSPLDGTPNRDRSKLTREEREAQYKAVRDRIFGDFQESVTSESASTGENSASLSRSSSASGNKKKAKKHKQPKDDSFDSRSAFVPSYSHISAQYSIPYPENNFGSELPPTTPQYGPTAYGATPTQNFPGFDMNGNFNTNQPFLQGQTPMQHYNVSDWQQTQAYQAAFYQFPGATMYQQPAPMMSPGNGQMPPNAAMNSFSGWYGMPAAPYSPAPMASPPPPLPGQAFEVNDPRNSLQAYQYGQSSPVIQNQHQSYGFPGNGAASKSLFNPQTRAFVPAAPNGRGNGGRVGRKRNTGRQSHPINTLSRPNSTHSNTPPREDSLQQKYGTPASLPKKPPPTDSRSASHGDVAKQTAAITVVGEDVFRESVTTSS